MARQRLQKLLAAAGICSRRRAEELLVQGRVKVNGKRAVLGDQADPLLDEVLLNGQPLPAAATPLTVLLHKPRGVHSTCYDPAGRPTVLELLPPRLARGRGLHPVGRLDSESHGALLLSNNGALTLGLTHPRYSHPKTYEVWVRGKPSPASLERWRRGLPLDGVASRPVLIQQLHQAGDRTLLELVMREGRNRQIRRTAELLGHPVLDLQRLAVGPVALGELAPGAWRPLHPEEEAALELLLLGDQGPAESPQA
ncbi:MAG: pseudouridine synthase [Synechococcus lacustris]